MVTLAIASQKGGVGKTTVSVNLAYAMARRGWHTLLLDSDPQGSVGLSLSRKAQERFGFYDAVYSNQDVERLVQPTRLPELKILTSGQNLSFFEGSGSPEQEAGKVADVFGNLERRGFDLIVADTPAGMAGFTGHILKCSDFVVVPQQAEPLGARSIPYVLTALRHLRDSGHQVKLAGILLTMMQQGSEACEAVVSELRDLLPAEFLFRDMVPRDVDFLEASARGVPLGLLRDIAPSGALIFDKLAAELETRVKLRTEDHGYDRKTHTPLMD